MKIGLLASQLSHRQNHELADLPFVSFTEYGGFAVAFSNSVILGFRNLAEAHFGDIRECPVGLFDRFFAEQVANSDAQVIAILEAMQHRFDVAGAMT